MNTMQRVSAVFGWFARRAPAPAERNPWMGLGKQASVPLVLTLFAGLLVPGSAARADSLCNDWSNAGLPRASHALAYDSARGVTVLFGGYNGAYFGDTWEWNGTSWTERSPAISPPARAYHAMAYDSARGVTVLFGGRGPGYLGDTWEWDGTTWTQRNPATSPPTRYDHAMVFDNTRGVTVLFGGYNGSYLGDTWEWDGTTWTQRSPTASPPARGRQAMAYDSARGVTVLFGGYGGSVLSDTWEWDGTTWTQDSPAISPLPRYYHAMAFDSTRGVTMLFGGYRSSSNLGDTWEWDGTNWRQRNQATSPPARSRHAMAHDIARGVTVLFGGDNGYIPLPIYVSDTWESDGTNWTQRPATSASTRYGHKMAYDSTRGVTVLFGGCGSNSPYFLGDTWEWDGTTWTLRSPATSPSVRSDHAMAYDSARGVTVLFGGYDGNSYLYDTWEWDGTNWTQRTPTTTPMMRHGHAMVYDSSRNVVVLFGGYYAYYGFHYLSDTWEWDGTTWTQRTPAASPQARMAHAMAYDSARGVTVLFGGESSSSPYRFGDTWEWDGTTWAQRDPATSPTARTWCSMAYDSARGTTLLFGGGGGSNLNDTWEWNGTNWAQRSLVNNPPARNSHAMAYDSARGATLLFGGYWTVSSNFGDTWELSDPLLDSDLDLSGGADGLDVSAFVSAVLNASTLPSDLCHGDFSGNGVIDIDDLPGFIGKLLGT